MNKLVKSAVAGAAGIALLLGGAGTFALWNSTASVAGGTIVAGNLVVDANTAATGVWTANGSATPITLSSFKAVPGDVLTYTKTVKVTATGETLVATLGLGAASIAPTNTATAADTALAAYLTKSATLTATGTGVVASGNDYTIAAGSNGITNRDVTVTARITFPKSGTAGAENNTKLGSVNLDALVVTLTQNS